MCLKAARPSCLQGKASKVVKKLRGGLLSGMSYSNARTIAEMHARAQFIIVKNRAGRNSAVRCRHKYIFTTEA